MRLLSILRTHWFTAVLVMALGIATYQNLTLGLINSGLRARTQEALAEPADVNDYVGKVRGVQVDGTYVTFDPVKRGMLVMTISSSCGICQRNRRSAQALAEFTRAQGLAVVWVSRDSPADTAKYFDWKVAPGGGELIIADPPHATYQALRLGSVPQTLVVNGQGFVQHVALGELNPAAMEGLRRAVVSQVKATSTSTAWEPRTTTK